MEYFLQQLINGVTLGSIYGLIAIGYTMVYGIIGMINFAHGDVFMVGSVAAFLVVLGIGENPLEATALLLRGALGSAEGIGFTLYYTTNFIFTGLAVAVAFHAGLFNIGGEGQATIAGIGAALACAALSAMPGFLATLGFLAAPIALLPLIGWAGWRTPAGAFGAMLYGGYAVFLMIAGRANNFYWALIITPAYFVGLAFLPMALRSLWRASNSSR